MKITLCGYNWAGCRALDHLLSYGHDVNVFTHKGPEFVPSLYDYANSRKVPVTTQNINASKNLPRSEFLCSVYYRYIIKEDVLRQFNYNAMNLHPSLLPKYRGCSSLTWAMINGESKVGFTYHLIDKSCDTGNILLQKTLPIFSYENQSNLYSRVMFHALESFTEAFDILVSGEKGTPQSGDTSYYKRGAPYNGEINSKWEESKIIRFINAMTNPPLPYATYKGKEVKNYGEYLKIRRRT